MSGFPFLSAVIFLPLLGALLIMLFIRGDEEVVARNSRYAALWTSLATFVLSMTILYNFDPNISEFQFIERLEWISGSGIAYLLGIDGISLFFILLTTLLIPVCILVSWNSITHRVKEYMVAFLLLETLTIGVFCALDFVMFYFFFEAVLIPMFIIIGVWGGENKVYAAFKFFLYTLLGSVLLLLAMIYMYQQTNSMNFMDLMRYIPSLPLETQKWLWLALFASFAVKVPMWPFHTWLPDAHVQAPTAGSVVLAGILLKLGGYGFLRLSLPMLPDASAYFAPLVYGLSIAAVIYTSLVALMQEDMKKLIAYSSVAHMGFVTAGIFALNQQAIEGAIFQMISHGFVSGALFMCVGVLYERLHTKKIDAYSGVVTPMPLFALFFMIFTMASVGLPGTSGFVGEFLIMLGVFRDNLWVSAGVATGVILGAAYMLWLYKRVMWGKTIKSVAAFKDLSAIEIVSFLPFLILSIVLGFYPSLITSYLHSSVTNLIQTMALANG